MARALGTLPLLAEALARGRAVYAKVRALTRVATPETEERLLAVGRAGTAAHVERIVRGWRRVDRQAEAREAARRHASRALHVYQDEDGMVVVRGRLEPEAGALFLQALAAAREALYQRGAPATAPPATPTGASRRRWAAAGGRAGAGGGDARCTRGSTPGRRGSATRWWSTWTPRCWRTRSSRASPCSRTARTFPRKRRSDWRVTRAAW